MQPIAEFYPLLTAAPRRVVITMHQKPDADAMGSTLGLAHFLTRLGHHATVVSPTNWGLWVGWMPGTDEVVDFEMHRTQAETILREADWIFCLDFNHFGRTKGMEPLLRGLQATKILIDHHQEPETAAFDYGFSSTAKSSTCEMVYDFITESGHRSLLTPAIMQCLYAGVVGDTGSFRFGSTSASVHHMVAYFKEQGLDHGRVHEQLFDNNLENRLRFLGHVLSQRMQFFYEYNAALISIPKTDLLKYGIRTGDTEGIVNYPLSVQGIKLVGCCIDRDEERRWSFRSKGAFDCNTFARRYFSGGGHYNAAGGKDAASLTDTVEKFKNYLQENKTLLQ